MERLWIITEFFYPDENPTSYILGEMAKKLTEKYDVKVICSSSITHNSKESLNSQIEVIRVCGKLFDKNSIIGRILNFFLVSRRLLKVSKSKIRNGDKVLMVTNPAPLVLLMSKLKTEIGFQLYILVHDIFPENTKAAGFRFPGYSLLKKKFDCAYSHADSLFVLGRDMECVMKEKIKNYSSECKIILLPNWADVSDVCPQPFPQGKIILQYAGNVGRVQGLSKVVETLPDFVDLHIYGSGAEDKRIKRIKRSNVFFHGPFPRFLQNEVLSACHFAIVSLRDGMYGLGVPSKVYNILASGRPILFFGPKNSEVDLLIKEHNVGFYGWPTKWDKEEIAKMGRKARKLAIDKYSKDMILDEFLRMV